jgi:hypothetical protein
MEYSDPELEELEDVQLNHFRGFAALDPVSNAILHTALQEERLLLISCDRFLEIQREMIPKYREVTVKWLIQLNYRFNFSTEAIYNAVKYFDLVSMHIPIPKSEIQVYGATCYCLAIKVDARTYPGVEELNAMTGECFTNVQYVEKEAEILQSLGFRLSYPTIRFHLRIYLEALKPGQEIQQLTGFFGEIALMKFGFLNFPTSAVALAVIVFASASIGHHAIAEQAIKMSHWANREESIKCIDLLITETEAVVKNWKNPAQQELLELLAKINFQEDFRALVLAIKR